MTLSKEQSFGVSALTRLTKDLKSISNTLGREEARYLVDLYYQVQDFRIRTANQIRSINQNNEIRDDGVKEPHETLLFFKNNFVHLEDDIKKVLDVYTSASKVGLWCKSIPGIGPVITAGLLSNLDITKAPTAGHFWSFGGIDPTREWLGKTKSEIIIDEVLGDKKNKDITTEDIILLAAKTGWKVEYLEKNGVNDKGKFTRANLIKACSLKPWNGRLKVIYWKIGQSFVKVCNNENDIYGKIYKQRKAYEIRKNENGDYADQAKAKLEKNKIGKDTEAYKYYIEGKLPPAHIQARAERYTTQIFISHLHHVMYLDFYKQQPPKPFAIAILEHTHEIPVPNLHILN